VSDSKFFIHQWECLAWRWHANLIGIQYIPAQWEVRLFTINIECYGDFAICLTAIHLHPVCNCTLSIYRNKEQNNTEHHISEQYLRPWSRCDLAISPWCPQVHPRVMYCPSASPVSPDVTWARQTRASSSPCALPLAASPHLVSWGASATTLCFLCCFLNCRWKSHEVPFGPGGILLVGLWWLPALG